MRRVLSAFIDWHSGWTFAAWLEYVAVLAVWATVIVVGLLFLQQATTPIVSNHGLPLAR